MTNNTDIIKILNYAPGFTEGINSVLSYIGEVFGVSRVYIFETDKNEENVSNTFEWCAKGITPEIDSLKAMSLEEYGFNSIFRSSDTYICSDVEEIPLKALKEALKNQNIKALMICAIREAGKFRGFIGVDDCTRTRHDWENYDNAINELQLASSLISLYMIKERNYQKVLAEQKIRENEKQIYENKIDNAYTDVSLMITDTLVGARIGMWSMIRDENGTKLFADSTARELIGYEDQELSPEEVYKFFSEHIDPDHVYKFVEYDRQMLAGQRYEIVYPYHHPKRGVITIRCGGMMDASYTGKGIRFRGYHQEITEYANTLNETAKHLDEALEMQKNEGEILGSVARIYNSMHLIDFSNDTFREISSIPVLSAFIQNNINEPMQDIMWGFIKSIIHPAYIEKMIEFTDFSTLDERIENKTDISLEVLNSARQWWDFKFIRVGKRKEKLSKVLFVSKNINESKSREEILRTISNTDELTKLLNRHAYEDAVAEFEKQPVPENLKLIAIDLNGLKITNDSMGHEAGDELLIATAECCREAIGDFGKLYRIGGDEFTAIIQCTDEELVEILLDMDTRMRKWRGKYSSGFSFSKGVVSAYEMPDASMQDLEKTADHRMYIDKKLYYSGRNNRRK